MGRTVGSACTGPSCGKRPPPSRAEPMRPGQSALPVRPELIARPTRADCQPGPDSFPTRPMWRRPDPPSVRAGPDQSWVARHRQPRMTECADPARARRGQGLAKDRSALSDSTSIPRRVQHHRKTTDIDRRRSQFTLTHDRAKKVAGGRIHARERVPDADDRHFAAHRSCEDGLDTVARDGRDGRPATPSRLVLDQRKTPPRSRCWAWRPVRPCRLAAGFGA